MKIKISNDARKTKKNRLFMYSRKRKGSYLVIY